MRTFAIILIFLNLLALFLSFKKQPKAVWLGVASANLAALFLHGIFEGFRYQMAFSYVFVALLVVYALAKSSGKFFQNKTPKALKFTAVSLAVVFLALTSFLAYAFPVFTLPKLTGDYAVGVKYFELIDENRADPFLDKSPRKRELMVKVYYPAKPDGAKPFSPYFHGSTKLLEAFARFYHLPEFAFDYLRLVRTHYKQGLPVSGQEPSYPVVLFSHGAGTTMEVETSQSEDLASHGYIVVDVDHTYVSAASAFPNRIVTAQEATTNFNVPDPAAPITQIMAEDDEFVIKKLGQLNEGRIDPGFKGKLNLDEMGVIGHSVGGAAAYNLALRDRRIKAAIDLDGAVYITPPKDLKGIAPFLMLANDRYHIQAIEKHESLIKAFSRTPQERQKILSMYGGKEGYEEARSMAQKNIRGLVEVLKAQGNLFTIQGSDHMKFTDIGLFIGSRQLRELLGIRGKTDPARCLEITEALTASFFDQHLKGQNPGSLRSLEKTYPELERVNLH